MKPIIKISYIVIFLISCKTLHTNDSIQGEYYSKGKDYEYNLILQTDNHFVLHIKYQDANPKCEGNWKLNGDKTIYLKCVATNDVSEMLSNGYMNEREHNIEIISKRKLKFKGVILKRK